MANYLTYPFKNMRITQGYTGTTSHLPHTTGTPKDYPIDEAGKDTGRDPIYAPCKMVIKRIYGVGTSGTNTLWLESTEKEKLANGKIDYITLMLTHPNDSDLKRLTVGQTFKKGEIICYEGTDGATGNHIHLSVGMGKYKANGWAKNSYGKWVLTCTNGAIKPEDAFYIDPKFTNVIKDGGLKFKQLPKETKVTPKYTTGTYKVTADVLNVRAGAGTKFACKTFSQLSANAQTKIKALAGKKVNGYVKGLVCTVSEVKGNWGKTPSGWICLDYCKKV